MCEPNLLDILALDQPMEIRSNKSGTKIAFTLDRPNINKNHYQTICYVYLIDEGRQIQLTQKGKTNNLRWLDDDSLAGLYVDPEDAKSKIQIVLFRDLAGQPMILTSMKGGVNNFEFYDDGILFIANDPDSKKDRTNIFGEFSHVEEEISSSRLYFLNIYKMMEYRKQQVMLHDDAAKELVEPVLEISNYFEQQETLMSILVPHARKDKFILITRPKDDLVYLDDITAYLITLDANMHLDEMIKAKLEKKEGKTFGDIEIKESTLEKGDIPVAFSPDDSELVINTYLNGRKFYHSQDLSIISINDWQHEDMTSHLKKQCITAEYDNEINNVIWTEHGIYGISVDHSQVRLVHIVNKEIVLPDLSGYSVTTGISDTSRGIVLFLESREHLPELAVYKDGGIEILTNMNEVIIDWKLGTSESISWKSVDGMEIEGVLRKPRDFDLSKTYPLVCIVHGGPAWYSSGSLLSGGLKKYYPATQFLNKGILVLEPNYRGSIGRGAEFKEAYRFNIGFADLGDVESGVDYLISQGLVDKDKVGIMGWSQGGYISAFASTHSKKFAAICVGAGVASWKTYYDSNDIRQWAIHYLGGTPREKPDYYKTTAPMNKIEEASTPTMIQHGEMDQRCPTSNATELFRGLKEQGVQAELFIFKGMPHGITKPRENLAVLYQNLNWFSHHLLGEELILHKENSSN
ncbi:MAG: S9 family peptidase [Candidatus Heimdallarchaeota archaeon]|nr:S9 family peptidase [Candidatus Heimdallarchaeota archaeon]